MESISKDLFTSILSYLPTESIAALITNTNLDKAIKESAKTNIFWKQRVETLLGKYLVNVYPNWKLVHDNLIEDFKGNFGLKQDQMGNTHLINEQSSLFRKKALIASSKNGHLEVVKLLLADDRVNPSVNNNEAIIIASENGHSDVVKLLPTL